MDPFVPDQLADLGDLPRFLPGCRLNIVFDSAAALGSDIFGDALGNTVRVVGEAAFYAECCAVTHMDVLFEQQATLVHELLHLYNRSKGHPEEHDYAAGRHCEASYRKYHHLLDDTSRFLIWSDDPAGMRNLMLRLSFRSDVRFIYRVRRDNPFYEDHRGLVLDRAEQPATSCELFYMQLYARSLKLVT